MYCRNCGTKLDDDMKFCPECGAPVVRENGKAETDFYSETQPAADPNPQPKTGCEPVRETPKDTSTASMVFGLISLGSMQIAAVSFAGLGWLFAIAGIVFGIIAQAKSAQYRRRFGIRNGKAKAGKILGCIATVFCILILVAAVAVLVYGLIQTSRVSYSSWDIGGTYTSV